MTIKKLEARATPCKKKLPDGTEIVIEKYSYTTVLKEISELIEFEQMLKPKKGVYKKRCIVFSDKGDFIAPYSYEELLEIKRNQYNRQPKIGFKLSHEKKSVRRTT